MLASSTTASDLLLSHKEAHQYVSNKVLHREEQGTKSTLTRCGDLACQHDSYLKSYESASVLSFVAFDETAVTASPKKKGKSKKGEKSNSSSTESPSCNEMYSPTQYAIAISNSVFFPEGGGQPSDRGVLTIHGDDVNNKITLSVVDAQNIDNVCVLTCRAPKDVSHETVRQALLTASASSSSSSKPSVSQQIDWDRRFDLMTQHSGQHLISAVAINEFNMLTHSFSLGENSLTSYIDFTIDSENCTVEQSMENLKYIEDLVNERIRQNLPMTPTWLDPKDPEFGTKVRSRLLPAGLVGKIRLVEIGGGGADDVVLDCNTCCGTHVQTLGDLQMIKFFRVERVKSTTIRVYFAAGAVRLRKILDENFLRQSQMTSMLSCAEEEHVSRLSVLLDDKKAKEREIKALNTQLCGFRAKEILTEFKANDNVAVVDLGATDMTFMVELSANVLHRTESSGKDGILLLLVAGTEGSDEGTFLLTGDVALVDSLGKTVAELLSGRGGGKNGKFQGKGSKIRSSLKLAKAAMLEGKK